jgi:hypothetical protein
MWQKLMTLYAMGPENDPFSAEPVPWMLGLFPRSR